MCEAKRKEILAIQASLEKANTELMDYLQKKLEFMRKEEEKLKALKDGE